MGKSSLISCRLMLKWYSERSTSRIANDADHTGVAKIEILVALDDAWPLRPCQAAPGDCFRVRREVIDVTEIHLFVRISEVGDEKAGPGVSRFGIGDEKYVIGIYLQITPGPVEAERHLCSCDNALDHGEQYFRCIELITSRVVRGIGSKQRAECTLAGEQPSGN
jgi:hypothetical protein